MAWQLHYTSARRGPTGRAGFQFVAETPGLPDGARAAVTPYLAYRPPPGAPPEPGDGELERFPVALLYDRITVHEHVRPLLLRCRYLGRDYSGRYGNFFAHALVADAEELEGLRPAELWRAALWADRPSAAADLPELEDLTPDAALAPDALAGWLAGLPDGYPLLAHLVDAVTGVLGRGHGRVVLVSGDIERVARWIAVLSYSLPVAAAARMSFVTYSADPDGAAQRVVGTTPDVWATAHRAGAHAFALDEAPPPGAGAASRFARTVAGCWRDADFAGLDALGELALLDAEPDHAGSGPAALDPAALDRAAALLALCRGEAAVTTAEEAGAARLLARNGVAIPDWVWRDLVPGVPAMGFDLAVAVHGRARDAGAPDVAAQCALRAAVLAVADAEARPLLARHAHLLADLPADARTRLAEETSAALRAAPSLAEIAQITGVAARAGITPDPGEVTAAAMARVRPGDAALDRDLAAALAACSGEARARLVEGVLRGLAAADAATRTALLTDAACDLLAADLLTVAPPATAPPGVEPPAPSSSATDPRSTAPRPTSPHPAATRSTDPRTAGPHPAERHSTTPGPAAPHLDAPRPDAPRPDAPRSEAPRSEAPRSEAPRSEAPRSASPRPNAPQPANPRPDAPHPASPRPNAPRPDIPHSASPRPDAPHPASPRPNAPRPDIPHSASPRPDAPQPASPRPMAPPPTAPQADDLPAGAAVLTAFPEVALPVLASAGRRHRDRRVLVTGVLLDLPVSPADLDPALGGVWAAPPGAAECLRLLDAHADRLAEHPALAALPSRAFGWLRADALTEPSTLQLAARVQALLPGGPAARDAAVVRAYSDALTADEPEHVARAIATICDGGAATLAEEALGGAARRLARRTPAFRAAVLAAAPAPVRARLGACWTADLPERPHRADHGRRHELVEVVLRLRRRGVAEPGLDAWARAAAARRFAARRLEAHLSGEPGLRAELRDLLDQDPGR
ncbi:hypothetical protein ACIBF1_45515 [Spirillospora sp. NPDC050679]